MDIRFLTAPTEKIEQNARRDFFLPRRAVRVPTVRVQFKSRCDSADLDVLTRDGSTRECAEEGAYNTHERFLRRFGPFSSLKTRGWDERGGKRVRGAF